MGLLFSVLANGLQSRKNKTKQNNKVCWFFLWVVVDFHQSSVYEVKKSGGTNYISLLLHTFCAYYRKNSLQHKIQNKFCLSVPLPITKTFRCQRDNKQEGGTRIIAVITHPTCPPKETFYNSQSTR